MNTILDIEIDKIGFVITSHAIQADFDLQGEPYHIKFHFPFKIKMHAKYKIKKRFLASIFLYVSGNI